MISSNDLRPGVTIEYKNDVWQVIESMHVKPGKGPAFVRTKLRQIDNGFVLNVTFRAGERLQTANVEKVTLTYFYKDNEQHILMNDGATESFELESKDFGRNADLLKEGLRDITALRHRGRILRVELPTTIDLEVRKTPPDQRGDTNSGSGKLASLETGAVICVPFHIKVGDKVRIDTRSREYVSRVSE